MQDEGPAIAPALLLSYARLCDNRRLATLRPVHREGHAVKHKDMKYINPMQYARAGALILFGLFLLGMYDWSSLFPASPPPTAPTSAPYHPHYSGGGLQGAWVFLLSFFSIGFGVAAIAFVRWRTRRAQQKEQAD